MPFKGKSTVYQRREFVLGHIPEGVTNDPDMLHLFIRHRLSQVEGVEFTHPPGFAIPLRVHYNADEAFYVLAGRMRGFRGDQEWGATTGSFVWLPRGIPQWYAVDGDEQLRTLAITSPAGFDGFIIESGEPAVERTLPPPRRRISRNSRRRATSTGLRPLGHQYSSLPPQPHSGHMKS